MDEELFKRLIKYLPHCSKFPNSWEKYSWQIAREFLALSSTVSTYQIDGLANDKLAALTNELSTRLKTYARERHAKADKRGQRRKEKAKQLNLL